MTITRPPVFSRSWILLAAAVTLLEFVFIYEAIQADLAGYQRIFGVFVGLAILCFGTLVYAIKTSFYDSAETEISS